MNRAEKQGKHVAEKYRIGQKVVAACDIAEAGSEDAPGGILAFKGERLVVRKFGEKFFPLYVSHEQITDRTFGARLDEIRLL
jgi:hypothetical protein